MHISSWKEINDKVRVRMLGLDLQHRSGRSHHKVLAVLAMNKPHAVATVRSLACISAKRGFD